MVAQNEAAIALLHAIDGGRLGYIPIVGRIVPLQFFRRRLGMEADQAAGGALDHLEHTVGGAVETVRSRKQEPNHLMTTRRTAIAGQFACSESSRRGIRFASSSFRIWLGVS